MDKLSYSFNSESVMYNSSVVIQKVWGKAKHCDKDRCPKKNRYKSSAGGAARHTSNGQLTVVA